jgi:parallel beta-helix repeat protein
MGVIVSIGDRDIDQDAIAELAYRKGTTPFQSGFPLSRVSDTQFVGSLFWLEPGMTYDVRVTFVDANDVLHCAMISAAGATRAEIATSDPVNTHVVSPDGSGSSCTMEAPCALITGLSRALPGDAVVLRDGIYYQGDIRIPRSGTTEGPIVIQSAPGERAILDGSDPESFTWNPRHNGVYATTANVSEPSIVMANGQRLYRYQSLEDLQNLSWELPGFYAQGYQVYVHLDGGADPNEYEMNVGRRMYGFWVEQDYIHIKNLTFRNYDVRWYRAGLYIRNGSFNLVHGCTFSTNGYGIILQGAAHRNVIEENEFYDTIYDWPWDAVKALHDQTGQGMETGGLKVFDPHPNDPSAMPRGTVIRRNRFHDFFDSMSVCTFETAVVPTNETDIYQNHVYRMGDDGVEADGYCSNVRIWSNTFEDVLVGISLAPARIGPTYVIRNLIHDIGRLDGCPFGAEGPCGGTALKFQFNAPGSGPMYIFHNTMESGSEYYTAWISENATWPLLVSRNNIWGSSRSGGLGIAVDDPIDFDYDNVYVHPGSVLVYWRGQDYRTLNDFRLASGQEMNGLSVDPGFANMSSADYTLRADSGLIDAGGLIPGINHDFTGPAPDIGAFEFLGE